MLLKRAKTRKYLIGILVGILILLIFYLTTINNSSLFTYNGYSFLYRNNEFKVSLQEPIRYGDGELELKQGNLDLQFPDSYTVSFIFQDKDNISNQSLFLGENKAILDQYTLEPLKVVANNYLLCTKTTSIMYPEVFCEITIIKGDQIFAENTAVLGYSNSQITFMFKNKDIKEIKSNEAVMLAYRILGSIKNRIY